MGIIVSGSGGPGESATEQRFESAAEAQKAMDLAPPTPALTEKPAADPERTPEPVVPATETLAAPDTEPDDTEPDDEGDAEPEPAARPKGPSRSQRYQAQVERERQRAERAEAALAEIARGRTVPASEERPRPPAAETAQPLTEQEFYDAFEQQNGRAAEYTDYVRYEATMAARAEYQQQEQERQHRESVQRQQRAAADREAAFQKNLADTAAQYDDWDDTVMAAETPVHPLVWAELHKLGHPGEMFRYLALHPEENQRIHAMETPQDAFRALNQLDGARPWERDAAPAASAPGTAGLPRVRTESRAPRVLPPTPSGTAPTPGFSWDRITDHVSGADYERAKADFLKRARSA